MADITLALNPVPSGTNQTGQLYRFEFPCAVGPPLSILHTWTGAAWVEFDSDHGIAVRNAVVNALPGKPPSLVPPPTPGTATAVS